MWDFVTYVVFTLCVIFLLLVFGVSEYTGDYGLALFLLLLHFGFAAIPISYLTSKVVGTAIPISYLTSKVVGAPIDVSEASGSLTSLITILN